MVSLEPSPVIATGAVLRCPEADVPMVYFEP